MIGRSRRTLPNRNADYGALFRTLVTQWPETSHWQRWARWNLIRNPFGECTRRQRAELAVIDWDEMGDIERFTQPRHAHQWIGRCGRGKTTRMLALGSRLPGSYYVYLAENEPIIALPSACPLMIDEAQRMPRKIADQVFRSGVPLVLATHRDLTARLNKFGYRVTSQTIDQQNTPELIQDVLNRRIKAARQTNEPIPEITITQAMWLHEQFGSDVRAIEGFLYEQWQNMLTRFIKQGESIDAKV